MTKLINFLKWFFAFAVFGVAVYAIYQGWQYLKAKGSAVADALKPSAYKKGAEQTTFEKYFPNIAEIKDKALDYFVRNPINPVVPIVTDIIDKAKDPVTVSPIKEFVSPSNIKTEGATTMKVATDNVIIPEEKSIFKSVVEFFTPSESSNSTPGIGLTHYSSDTKNGALGVSEIKNTKTFADLSGVVGKNAMVKVAPSVLKKTPAVSTAFKQVSKSMR